jgi:hypothetical protein
MALELTRAAQSGNVDRSWMSLLGDDIQIPDSGEQSELCWQDGQGLKVWNCTVRDTSKINPKGIVLGYDVVIITAHTLQDRDTWVKRLRWSTVLADEGHEFLCGQHGKTEQSITLQNWRELQSRTKSIFIISGTPFVTNIVHDFGAMTHAVAREAVRRQWSDDCTDEGLKALVSGWIPLHDARYDKFKVQEDNRRKTMAELLSIFMIKRTEKSIIRGQKVIQDYFKLCQEDIQLIAVPQVELHRRDMLFRERFTNIQKINNNRNQWMRCLS